MPITCEEARDNIDAWALGALDAEDARELERHLLGCAECTLLADAARDAAGMIALAVPMHVASSALKARVMAGAAVLQERPHTPARKSFRFWPASAAAVAIVGLGLGAWGINAQNDLNNLEDNSAIAFASASTAESKYATANTQLVMASNENKELGENQDAITEIVSEPDAARLAMTGTEAAPESTGRYVWSERAGMGSLVARGLPALAAGTTYCLWLVYEKDWVLAGKFTVDSEGTGRLVVADIDFDSAETGALEGYAVSAEPETDVTRHSGQTFLQASVQP